MTLIMYQLLFLVANQQQEHMVELMTDISFLNIFQECQGPVTSAHDHTFMIE